MNAASVFRQFRDTGFGVSADGQVHSPNGKIVKQWENENGYLRVHLGSEQLEYVHRMVLIAFLGEPPSPDHESDHRDKIRSHNHLKNLRWKTKAANLADRRMCKGAEHHNSKLTDDAVGIILAGPFYRGRDGLLATEFNTSRETIRDVRLGTSWKHLTITGAKL